jgi:hypothetical protein
MSVIDGKLHPIRFKRMNNNRHYRNTVLKIAKQSLFIDIGQIEVQNNKVKRLQAVGPFKDFTTIIGYPHLITLRLQLAFKPLANMRISIRN